MADVIGRGVIEVSADASGLKAGIDDAKRSIRTLGDTAKKSGKEAADGMKGIGEGGGLASKKIAADTKNMISSIQRQIAVMEAGSRSGSKYYETIASQRGVNVGALKPYLDQLDAVAAKQKLAAQAISATAPALDKTGISAKATAAALRNVPAQFTDIVVSLQGGQAPLTVLLQQGGQLKDMFGGIGPAARALGGYILGMANPFTIAGAAVGGLAYAFHEGSSEMRNFQNAAIISGNAIGLSTSQFAAMSQGIAGISGTRGNAAAVLTEIAQTGKLAGSEIQNIAEAAVLMEKATGQAVSKTVAEFVKLADSPVAASLELNKTYNYLTEAVYEQIKALEAQGNKFAAAELAERSYADTLKSRAATVIENAGLMQKAWGGVMGAAKGAWDAMLGIGRESSLAEKLASVSAEIAKANKPFNASAFGDGNAEARAKLQTNLALQASLQEMVRLEKRGGEASAARLQIQNAGIAGAEAVGKANDQAASKQEQMNKALKTYRDNIAAVKAANPDSVLLDPKKIAKAEAGIREQFKESGGAKGRSNLAPENIAKGQLALDLSSIKMQSAELISIYDDSEKIMQALRNAGLVDEREYYASKLAFLNLNSDAQAQALEQEIERLEREKLLGKDRIDNERKVAEAKSRLAKVKTDQSIGGIVIGIQDASSLKGRAAEVDKFFGDAQIAADARNAYAVEGIRQSMLSQAQIETEAYAARLAELTIYNASRLEGEATVNGLIEAEKSRHLGVIESLQISNDAKAVSMAADAADQLYAVLQKAGADKTALGKSIFLASKALAVAEIILNTELGAIKAFGQFGPFGIPLSTYIRATGYASAGLVAGLAIAEVAGGRAAGGPVGAGKLYEVNEKGPELLTTGGKDYLMMGGRGGSVTPNSKLGGSGAITIVNNTSAKIGKVTEQRMSNGERALIIEEAVAATAAQFSDPNSKTSRAMSRNYATQRSR